MSIASWFDTVERQTFVRAAVNALTAEDVTHPQFLGTRPLGLTASSLFDREHLKKKHTHVHTGKPHPECAPRPPTTPPMKLQPKAQAHMTKGRGWRGRKKRFTKSQQKRGWSGWIYVQYITAEYCVNNSLPPSIQKIFVWFPGNLAICQDPPVPPAYTSSADITTSWLYAWNTCTQAIIGKLAVPQSNVLLQNVTGTPDQKMYVWAVGLAALKSFSNGQLFKVLGPPDLKQNGTPAHNGVYFSCAYS